MWPSSRTHTGGGIFIVSSRQLFLFLITANAAEGISSVEILTILGRSKQTRLPKKALL